MPHVDQSLTLNYHPNTKGKADPRQIVPGLTHYRQYFVNYSTSSRFKIEESTIPTSAWIFCVN